MGFYVGIYANQDWFINKIDTVRLEKYDKWVAKWSSNKPNLFFNYGLWQNSDSGNISGYRIDTDISFLDYPNIIINKKLNGYSDKKSLEEIAKEVINGQWGNGKDRKIKLTHARL